MLPYKIISINKETIVVQFGVRTITYSVILENDKFADIVTTDDDSSIPLNVISILCSDVEKQINEL